jgi:hypothetical protein
MMPKNKVLSPDLLADAEERARSCQGFEIPTRAEREDLWPGDLVKLVFESIGERMWVRVLTREDGEVDFPFLGIIESEPVTLDTTIQKGDKVGFGPEHVADIAHVILRKTRERHQQRLSGDGLDSKFLVH